jgi:hypothetical protein
MGRNIRPGPDYMDRLPPSLNSKRGNGIPETRTWRTPLFHGPTRTPGALRRRGAGGDGRRRGGERDTFLVRRGLNRLGGVRLRDPLAPLALRMTVLRRRFGLGIYNLMRN